MPRFSLEEGRAIARIYNRSYDSKLLFLDENNLSKDKIDPYLNHNILVGDMLCYEKENRRIVKPADQEKIKEHLLSGAEPKDMRLKRIYNSCLSVINSRTGKEFFVNDGSLQPLPTTIPNQVDDGYVVGPQGSGKSIYIAKWLVEYTHMFPDNKIFLFSRKSEDEAFDAIKKIRRVKLDATFLDFMASNQEETNIEKSDDSDLDNLEVEQEEVSAHDRLKVFSNSCVIFDDIDTIQEKKVREEVRQLRNDLLETGRSSGIYVLSTSHLILDYKNTKTMLNEANFITIFPNQGSKQQISGMLERYHGLTAHQIKRIFSLPSRWVTLYTRSPQYIIYESGCYFLN